MQTQVSLRKNSGFTILETIIAITVIGMVIAAATQLTQSSMKIGRSTMSQFIAFHLAEEGLEIVRNMRDSNWLQNTSWRSGLDDGLYGISENSGNSGPRWTLKKISAADDNERERFQRTIFIDSGKITSRVTYGQIGGEKEISLTMKLTDWKKGPL
ncbi:prepilin-type N-terminal cleavage/methylation domain-containing protein [Candidatus Peregrinibacteria bacterium]|nr:prepilin-type N-terminal cleavage/methylation domain-containing protein [Candidatus Peregrinibacteria bacterium]